MVLETISGEGITLSDEGRSGSVVLVERGAFDPLAIDH